MGQNQPLSQVGERLRLLLAHTSKCLILANGQAFRHILITHRLRDG